MHKVEIEDRDDLLFAEPGHIGSGGNSGFQALNLAVQFGVTRILLVGFDMHAARGIHWYGHNTGKDMRNPLDHNFVRWRGALDRVAPGLAARGVDVVNASPDSALTCFRRAGIAEALAEWRL